MTDIRKRLQNSQSISNEPPPKSSFGGHPSKLEKEAAYIIDQLVSALEYCSKNHSRKAQRIANAALAKVKGQD